MLKIPAEYLSFLKQLNRTNVGIGYGGVKLFKADEMESRQIGYSITSDGKKLSGLGGGDWRSSWLAIGYEIALGDPLFLDVELASSPVMTARHGEGTWVPEIIASNLQGFFSILGRLSEIAQSGRWPLTVTEQAEFLNEVKRSKGDNATDVFWRMQIGLEE